MAESSTPRRLSRRTVAKGAAWAVPAVAVAVPSVSAAAASGQPPPPVFNFEGGCGTVGNGEDGCNGVRFSPQVPFFIQNPTGAALVFQITGTKFWIAGGTEPAAFNQNFQVWENQGTQDDCGDRIQTAGCDGYISITLAPGACRNLWLVGPDLGNASDYDTDIEYRFVTPSSTPAEPGDCTVVLEDNAAPDGIIPSNNCTGAVTPVTQCPAG